MNKYIKILTLSAGIIGATSPLALNKNDTNVKNNLYESVAQLDLFSAVKAKTDKLSKVQYNITINPSDTDVKFVSSTEDGEQDLSNEEAINYLSENLDETVTQYEQLKTSLSNAIKDTMDYLDKCNNNEVELDNEQKLQIKERYNTIKYLAETLEDLSEDVMCCIDGCEEDDDSDIAAGKYISAINSLEERIIMLQNAINELYQPLGHSYRFPSYIYGFRYNYPNMDDISTTDDITDSTDKDNSEQSTDNELNIDNPDGQDSIDNELNSENEDTSNTQPVENSDNNSDSLDNPEEVLEKTGSDDKDGEDTANSDKPTTFGLKSNIDTYGPSNKRNIDTFFNTALLDDRYGYGHNNGYYGYGMPYGNGYPNGFGYNGNMNGYGYNSNSINRNTLEQEVNAPVEVKSEEDSSKQKNNSNSETKIKDSSIPDTIKKERAKNIDTYTQTTIQSNINTMGESKISKFFKEKFNNLRDKVKNRKHHGDSNIEDEYSTNNSNSSSQSNSNEEVLSNLVDPQTNSNETNPLNSESQPDGLQDVTDLNNAIDDINNKINPNLDDMKIEKEIMPDAH